MNKNFEKIYDKDNYFIIVAKNKEIFDFNARGTKWGQLNNEIPNLFNHFNQDGPFIIAITPDDNLFLFHKNINPINGNNVLLSNCDKKYANDKILSKLSEYTKANKNDMKNIINYDNVTQKTLAINSNTKATPKWIENKEYESISKLLNEEPTNELQDTQQENEVKNKKSSIGLTM